MSEASKSPLQGRRARVLVIAAIAYCAAIGAYFFLQHRTTSAAGAAARAFARHLLDGDADAAYGATSRRFRRLNDAPSFAREYGGYRAWAGATLGRERVRARDSRATFEGRYELPGRAPLDLSVALVEEEGAWRVDGVGEGAPAGAASSGVRR